MNFLVGYAPLLDYRYWTNPRPVPLGPSLVGSIFAFFGWFVLAAVALYVASRFVRKNDKLKEEVLRRFSRALGLTALLGYTCLFFSYEQLPVLGMRFWFLLVLVLFVVWLARAINFAVRDYPTMQKVRAERENFEKYLKRR